MKAITFSICMMFVCTFVLQAQPKRIEIETKKDYQLKGKVKQIVEDSTGLILKFTPKGNLQFAGFLKDGKLDGRTYSYDKAGRLLKEKTWGGVYVYTYNAQGQMIKEQKMDGTKCISSKSFLYDMNGNPRRETSSPGTTCTLKNTYDSQKRLIKIERFVLPSNRLMWTTNITYLPNGWTRHTLREKSTIIVEEFDDKGRERSSVMNDDVTKQYANSSKKYDADDNLIESKNDASTTIYTYNTKGELTTKEQDRPIFGKVKIKYTYLKHDEVGNWTERITDEDGNQTIETRTIEYYN